jgi:hypothetical protein
MRAQPAPEVRTARLAGRARASTHLGEADTPQAWRVGASLYFAQHKLPPEAFEWYLDVRRYGTFPHAGFGLGIERTVAWLCGLGHVRETIPFPRMLNRLSP